MGLAPEKGPAVMSRPRVYHSAGRGRPRAGGSAGGRSEGPAEAAEDEGGEARKAEPTAPRPEASRFRRRGAQAP